MKSLINLALGLAAGYSVCRVLEARAQGVPLQAVFKLDIATLLTPVAKIAASGSRESVVSVASAKAISGYN